MHDTTAGPAVALKGRSQFDDARPEPASDAFGVAVAVPPSGTDAGVTTGASVGAVASRFTVTDWLVVPPPLVAEQVDVVPAVSATTVELVQPVLDDTVESASLTVHEIAMSPVYQPSLPNVPTTCGVTTGGVPSATTTDCVSVSLPPWPSVTVSVAV